MPIEILDKAILKKVKKEGFSLYCPKENNLNAVVKGSKFAYQVGIYTNEKFSWICAECGREWFSRGMASECRKRGHVNSYFDGFYTQKAMGKHNPNNFFDMQKYRTLQEKKKARVRNGSVNKPKVTKKPVRKRAKDLTMREKLNLLKESNPDEYKRVKEKIKKDFTFIKDYVYGIEKFADYMKKENQPYDYEGVSIDTLQNYLAYQKKDVLEEVKYLVEEGYLILTKKGNKYLIRRGNKKYKTTWTDMRWFYDKQ